MAIWDVFRKNKRNVKSFEEIRVGFILFNTMQMDWHHFAMNLKNDWNIDIAGEINESGQLAFEIDGMMVAYGFVETCVPNDEAVINAKNNFLWKEAVNLTKTHVSHAIVSVMRGANAVEQSVLFTKVASSLLKLENAIGIYQSPTVFSSDFYIAASEDLKGGNLPVLNWIYVGIYPDGDGFSGYTDGMTYFGKMEIEVIRTIKNPAELYGFFVDIVSYIIGNNVVLNHGETIGFTSDQKLQIKCSKGVSLKQDTLKIDF